MWDVRAKDVVSTLDHGAPVEDILMYPSGGIVVSAGGDMVKIWDTLKGQLVTTLSSHQKTVTCLALDFARQRLFSGSLDQHVKIYSTQNYQVVNTSKYPAPLMSLAWSPSSTHIVAGLADGMLSIRHRARQKKDTHVIQKEPEEDTFTISVPKKKVVDDIPVTIVHPERKKFEKLAQYDMSLSNFQFRKALNQALTHPDPLVAINVIQDLIFRCDLEIAVAGLNDQQLLPVLKWVYDNVTVPSYAETVLQFYSMLLKVYGPVVHQSPAILQRLTKINTVLEQEVTLQKEMFETIGMLDLLFAQKT